MSSTHFRITKHAFAGQHIRHYARATRQREEDVQYLDAKQYEPLSNLEHQEGDITIIGAGAVSFPKELYEPLWDDLLAHCKKHGIRVRAIWAVDKSDHGGSGMLNEHTLGDDPSFSDLARDLLNMVNVFRDQMTMPVVGFGHSMGGTALLELSSIHPRLFTALLLVDPVIGPAIKNAGMILINASTRRPDLWPSRRGAEDFFRSTKAFQIWDRRVQQLWLEHGLRDTPTLLYPQPDMVTLSTTKAVEAWNYGRPWFDPLPKDADIHNTYNRIKYPEADFSIFKTHPFYRPEPGLVWDALPRIRPSVLYIFPAVGRMSSLDSMTEKVARTGVGVGGSGGEAVDRVHKVIVEEGGHLAPFEQPDLCAREISSWLARDLKSWEERRALEKETADDKSMNMVALSDEYVRRAKEWFVTNKAKTQSKL